MPSTFSPQVSCQSWAHDKWHLCATPGASVTMPPHLCFPLAHPPPHALAPLVAPRNTHTTGPLLMLPLPLEGPALQMMLVRAPEALREQPLWGVVLSPEAAGKVAMSHMSPPLSSPDGLPSSKNSPSLHGKGLESPFPKRNRNADSYKSAQRG